MSAISGYPDAIIEQILKLPAGTPPDGESYSFEASSDNMHGGFAFLVLMVVLATISLIVRSYTKLRLMKQWNVEDTLLMFSLIILAWYFAEAILSGQHGASRHMWTITTEDYYLGLEHVNLCAVAYCVFQALVKAAILLQFHRIFVPSHSNIRESPLHYVIYATIGISLIFYTIMTFCTIWICNPREALWNPYVKGNCMDWIALSKAVALFTVISDLALFFIPVFPVLRLQMTKEKKIAIIAVFAIGFIDCMAAVLRTVYTWRLIEETDYSYNTSMQGMFTALEMSFGILVATLPVVPRFYKYVKQCSLMPSIWRSISQQGTEEKQTESKYLNSPSFESKNDARQIKSANGLPGLKKFSFTPNNTRHTRSDPGLYTKIQTPE